MIHIMGDLRRQRLRCSGANTKLVTNRSKLVQAGKLATLGELPTGAPMSSTIRSTTSALFVGSYRRLELGAGQGADRRRAAPLMQQVSQGHGDHLRIWRTSGERPRQPRAESP